MSKEEYDTNGDKLSKAVVNTSDFNSTDRYIGFVMKDGRILKCDKLLSEVVVYKCSSPTDCNTITCYKADQHRLKNRYYRLKKNGYFREITKDDDKYNI